MLFFWLVWAVEALGVCVKIFGNPSRPLVLKCSQTCFRFLIQWWVGIILRSGYVGLQGSNSTLVRSIVAIVFVADDEDLAQVSPLPDVSRIAISRRYKMSSSAASMSDTCIFFPVSSGKPREE